MSMTSRLTLTVKVGETVCIGDARVCVVKKSGQLASLRIDVDRDVPISLEKNDGPGKTTTRLTSPHVATEGGS